MAADPIGTIGLAANVVAMGLDHHEDHEDHKGRVNEFNNYLLLAKQFLKASSVPLQLALQFCNPPGSLISATRRILKLERRILRLIKQSKRKPGKLVHRHPEEKDSVHGQYSVSREASALFGLYLNMLNTQIGVLHAALDQATSIVAAAPGAPAAAPAIALSGYAAIVKHEEKLEEATCQLARKVPLKSLSAANLATQQRLVSKFPKKKSVVEG